jgi:hypothetical protein
MTDTTTKVSDSVARPVRTVVQMTPAAIICEIVDTTFWNMDERQYTAIFAGLTLLIGFLQVHFENSTGKAFLRNVPPKNVPVVDDNQPAGHDDDEPDDEDIEPAPRQWGDPVSSEDDHGHNVGEEVKDPFEDAR